MTISSAEYCQLMRLHPAAVTIITTGQAPNRTGLTATAVMSLSTDPVRIVCAVNKSSFTYAKILANRAFAVNTLAQDQISLAKCFSGQQTTVGEARFSAEDWLTLQTGSPVLKRAVMALDCDLFEHIDAGTHALIVGSILAGGRAPDSAPLIYVNGRWAGLEPEVEHV